MGRDRLIARLVLAALLLASIDAEARVYRWSDGRDVGHFSYRSGLAGGGSSVQANTSYPPLPIFAPFPDRAAQEWIGQVRGPLLLLTAVLSFALLGFLLALLSVALLVACRMVGQDPPAFRKAYGIVVVQFLAGLAVGPGIIVALGEPELQSLGEGLLLQASQACIILLVNVAVLRVLLCDSFPRALGLTVVANLVLLLLAFLLGLGIVCAGGVFALSN